LKRVSVKFVQRAISVDHHYHIDKENEETVGVSSNCTLWSPELGRDVYNLETIGWLLS
jgi:hypothetical protein